MRRKTLFLVSLIFVAIIIIGYKLLTDTYFRVGGNHLHLKSNQKELFWFNGIHNNNPNHRMFNDIEKEFNSFQPNYVLVEGDSNLKIYKSKEEAILSGGEPAFVSYLARNNGVQVESIEPSSKAQYDYLLEKYSGNDILAMYIIRQMYQIQREMKDSEEISYDFFEYFHGFIDNMINEGFPIENSVTNKYITDILRPHLTMEVTEDNWKDINIGQIVYFNNSPNIINAIGEDITNFRDIYSVKLIKRLVEENEDIKIFVMMGGDHIKNQKEELEEIFSQ